MIDLLLDSMQYLFAGRQTDFARQQDDGSYHPMRRPMTDDDWLAHLNHEETYGIYLVRPEDNKCRLICWDIDEGDNLGFAHQKACAILSFLQLSLGITHQSMAMEFSGRKGYHIWLFLEEWIPALEARRFGLWVLSQLRFSCEIYPKGEVQEGGYGTLVKIPLAKHRQGGVSHFVGTISGSRVVEDNAGYVSSKAPLTATEWRRLIALVAPEPPRQEYTGPVSSELLPCVKHILEHGQARGARNHALFAVATGAKRAGLNEEEAITLAQEANQKFSPPLRPGIPQTAVRSRYLSTGTGFDCTREFLHEGKDPHCTTTCPRYRPEYGNARVEKQIASAPARCPERARRDSPFRPLGDGDFTDFGLGLPR